MNQPHTEEGKSGSRPAAVSAASTRLSGPWLPIARGVWLVLVIPTVGFFLAGLPAFYAQIQRPCVNAVTCNFFGAMTARGLQALSAIGFSTRGYATFLVIFLAIIFATWCGIGFLIFLRRSDDWMAMLSSYVLIAFITSYPGISASALQLAVPALNAPIALLLMLGQVSLPVFFFIFPSGRLVPRWMGLILLFAILQEVTTILPATSLFNSNNWPGWLSSDVIPDAFVLFSQIYRYRRVSTALQRQQTKWVVFGLVIVVSGFIVLDPLFTAVFPVVFSPDSPYSLFQLLYPLLTILLPISFGFAILRSHLYDIDVLINRTLVYGTLTVLLALVYFGLVIGLGALLRLITGQLGQSPVVIVISTLAIAALFRPLRHRLQNIIDRRFYRRKYNAAKTLEAFSATLRNEVDLSQISERLLNVVQETMQPAHVSLWLRPVEYEGKQSRAIGARATQASLPHTASAPAPTDV